MKQQTDKWMHNFERPSVRSFPAAHSGGCVWCWREANGEISGDALNALMQSNCFQISHWWTVSFQPFNHLHTHTHTHTLSQTHTHTNTTAAPVSCSKSGHRYNALCLTPALWPVILKRRCCVSCWGGQDGRQEVMAGREGEGASGSWLICTQIN